MAEKIQSELQLSTELKEGDKGVFEVVADSELIYSKKATGEFPKEEKVIQILRDRSNSPSS